jgi:hypothetical protein
VHVTDQRDRPAEADAAQLQETLQARRASMAAPAVIEISACRPAERTSFIDGFGAVLFGIIQT